MQLSVFSVIWVFLSDLYFQACYPIPSLLFCHFEWPLPSFGFCAISRLSSRVKLSKGQMELCRQCSLEQPYMFMSWMRCAVAEFILINDIVSTPIVLVLCLLA